MSDFPNSVEGAGAVRYINPDSLNKNPASRTSSSLKKTSRPCTSAVRRRSTPQEIIGKGDVAAQTEQVLRNL